MSYYAKCDGYIDFVGVLDKETCEKAYSALRCEFDIDIGEYDDICGNAYTSFSVWNNEESYREYDVYKALDAVKAVAQVKTADIKYHGEDGNIWRIVFEDGEWKEEIGHVVFDKNDLERLAKEMGYKIIKAEEKTTPIGGERYLAHGTGLVCFARILDEKTYTKVQKMLGKHFDTCSEREHYPNINGAPAFSNFEFWTGPDDEEYNEKSVFDTLNAIVETAAAPITYAIVNYTGIEDGQKWRFIPRGGQWVKEVIRGGQWVNEDIRKSESGGEK